MYLEVQKVSKHFYVNREQITAVDQVSLIIKPGETIGILGVSGSGKTTLGQIIAGLQKPDEGDIIIEGKKIKYPYKGDIRTKIQILFQQPEASFNPRKTLWNSLKEPYILHKIPVTREKLSDYLTAFGLYPEHLDRYPRELSGGELQRAALARILVLKPEIIVLDEATSMLDSISQAQMIHMLEQIRKNHLISYVFISHDYELTQYFCDKIYWIEKGKLKGENENGNIK